MQRSTSLRQQANHLNNPEPFIEISDKKHNPNLQIVFSKKKTTPEFSSILSEEKTQNHNSLESDDHTRAKNCISCIADPLWKNVCMDLLNAMGPASVLKIWKSKLGELSPQEKTFDVTCETEETLKFIQQYDFVILGSLRQYFPALKKLRGKVI